MTHMRIGSYRLRAKWWVWLVTLVTVTIFVCLGVWQKDRAVQKAHMIAALKRAAKEHPTPMGKWLVSHSDASGLLRRGVSIRGRADGEHQLLLDNQTVNGNVGYDVWTPVHLTGARGVVLVNRGWVPRGPTRTAAPNPPVPSGVTTFRGIWRRLPAPGIRLGSTDCKKSGTWPRLLNYPEHRTLTCLFSQRLIDGELLLDPSAPHGFHRDWLYFPITPIRHRAYEAQWFALALTVLVTFVVVNTRRDDRDDDSGHA